ncbi:unnamed protein product [Rotaria sordida]|uniref:ADP ribosyltransferase domain-containing protein n=1 Tax=Rotaria sordida TaxID=392033 RepID=A0A819LLV0_9BILA|nr:unnamed protein product [Rotaria sordida]CAF3963674.1 unnamed protein product [Rotaria sordida]
MPSTSLNSIIMNIVLPNLDQFSQLNDVYIVTNKLPDIDFSKSSSGTKVRGIFENLKSVSKQLRIQAAYFNNEHVGFATLPPATTEIIGNRQETEFIYSELLLKAFLMNEPDALEIKDFVGACRQIYLVDNESALRQLDEFERSYQAKDAIRWYTRPIFLFGMINAALRSFNLMLMLHARFFIRDLHVELQKLYQESSNRAPSTIEVYRGQGMKRSDFDKLILKNTGGLFSLMTFWSTSQKQEPAQLFMEQDPEKVSILFKITLDTGVTNSLYADITRFSWIQDEEEILLCAGSIFRIMSVEPMSNFSDGWVATLNSTNDHDEQLVRLREQKERELDGMTPWYRFIQISKMMGCWDEAMCICDSLLDIVEDIEYKTKALGDIYFHKGEIFDAQGDFDEALNNYRMSVENYLLMQPIDKGRLAYAYSGVGAMLQKQGQYDKSLEHFERALALDLEATVSLNPSIVATRLNNIGFSLLYLGRITETLEHFHEALKIQTDCLPPIHPDLSITYSNIGSTYAALKDWEHAYEYMEKSLQIAKKCYTANQRSLAEAHLYIAFILNGLKRCNEALEHFEQAKTIVPNLLSDDDPQMADYRELYETLLANHQQ